MIIQNIAVADLAKNFCSVLKCDTQKLSKAFLDAAESLKGVRRSMLLGSDDSTIDLISSSNKVVERYLSDVAQRAGVSDSALIREWNTIVDSGIIAPASGVSPVTPNAFAPAEEVKSLLEELKEVKGQIEALKNQIKVLEDAKQSSALFQVLDNTEKAVDRMGGDPNALLMTTQQLEKVHDVGLAFSTAGDSLSNAIGSGANSVSQGILDNFSESAKNLNTALGEVQLASLAQTGAIVGSMIALVAIAALVTTVCVLRHNKQEHAKRAASVGNSLSGTSLGSSTGGSEENEQTHNNTSYFKRILDGLGGLAKFIPTKNASSGSPESNLSNPSTEVTSRDGEQTR